LLPFWPVPVAEPLAAWALPWLLTVVELLTVTLAELFAPCPIEPPGAMPPPLPLVMVLVEVLPVALAEPLLPAPVALLLFEAELEPAAEVPEVPDEPVGFEPPAAAVEGELALVLELPFWPVPEPLPLPEGAPPDLLVEPLVPVLPPPVGPPAIEPPVATPGVPSACAKPPVLARSMARHTELPAMRRLAHDLPAAGFAEFRTFKAEVLLGPPVIGRPLSDVSHSLWPPDA
jgi:hypothetical protein